jgi:hypothetical protein
LAARVRRVLRVVYTVYLIVFGLPVLGYILVTGVQEGTLWRGEGIVIFVLLALGSLIMWRG